MVDSYPSVGVSGDEIDERIDRGTNIGGLERYVAACRFDLCSSESVGARDGEVLGHFQNEQFLIGQAEPGDCGDIDLIGIASQSIDRLPARIATRLIKTRT